MVGDTLTEAPDKPPGCQAYEEAPVAVKRDEPVQLMVGTDADAVTVGSVLTVIVRRAVAVQPLAAVPVTVYVVVVVGETVTVVPLKLPGCHVYVEAPVPVIEVDVPEQIVALVTVVFTVGEVFTVIMRNAVPLQPLAAVPVRV